MKSGLKEKGNIGDGGMRRSVPIFKGERVKRILTMKGFLEE